MSEVEGPALSGVEGAAREFVDANVLVYAFDASAGRKQDRARAIIERLWARETGCLSVQVLQEFFVIVTRKVAKPLAVEDATARVREFATWRTFVPTAEDVIAAIGLHRESHIAFWDAMILHAASESGCDVLWTEDLSAAQSIRGVRIRNPFVEAATP